MNIPKSKTPIQFTRLSSNKTAKLIHVATESPALMLEWSGYYLLL